MNIYLYVKQCQHCGLKYFGKTINSNVEKYLGSGKYWLNHINSHGRNSVSTLNVWQFNNQNDATIFALDFSNKNKIVESKEWANLIPEDGLDGNSKHVITTELRKKFQLANKGKNNPMYGTFWINNGSENRKVRDQSQIPDGWAKGRYFNDEQRKKFVSRSKVGKNNTNYDPTIRHWINIETGEEISLPKYDFCQLKRLNGKKIRAVVQGKIEHYQGWKLKST
jgi:hypothetical protein